MALVSAISILGKKFKLSIKATEKNKRKNEFKVKLSIFGLDWIVPFNRLLVDIKQEIS